MQVEVNIKALIDLEELGIESVEELNDTLVDADSVFIETDGAVGGNIAQAR